MDNARVEAAIRAGLPCSHLEVTGDGRHFFVKIVSQEFAGLNRVRRQQRVYAVVGEAMQRDELHALSMQCFTPEEWRDAALGSAQ